MELEKLVDEYYAPKKGNELLVRLIEARLSESFGVDELTLGVGSGRSEFRREFDELLTTPIYHSIISDKYFFNRLETIKKYLDPRGHTDLRTDEFVATFIFLQEFDKILREYENEDPRQAGFKFETLFTVLFRGVQLNGSDITDAEIVEPRVLARFSYKFYSAQRRYRLDGSMHNLLRMMAEGKDVVYFICLKSPPNFKFYSFLVEPENFYSIIKKSTEMYGRYFSDFQRPEQIGGQELAALMLEHMKKKFGPARAETTTELFDQNFLSEVYNLTQLNATLANFSNTKCSYEGDISISAKIIYEAKLKYRDHELGRIGKLLEEVNALNKQMLNFFAVNSSSENKMSIIGTIDNIEDSFKEITQ